MSAKKILIVDDDESILDALTIILEDEGYKVSSTPKGEETVRKVKETNPDIILLDILMSGKDGRDICKILKNDLQTKQIPVIMISAHPSAENTIHECGAEDFLAKPFTSEDLLRKITNLI